MRKQLKNRARILPGLFALWLIGSRASSVRAEGSFLNRGREAVENLVGGIGPALSPGPGSSLVLPDIPAPPPPGVAVRAFESIVAKEVLEEIPAIEQVTSLRGHDYFSKHPDSPKLELIFKDPDASDPFDFWYPGVGPALSWRTAYYPSKGEKGPVLERVEIRLEKSLYERLSKELDAAYAPGYFKDEKAKTERLALFLAPRAAAELEAARLMREQETPGTIWVEGIEKLRLLWEAAALRAQFSRQEAMLGDPSFGLLPSERAYLIERFGEEGLTAILSPREALFSERAAQEWENLNKNIARGAYMLGIKGDGRDEPGGQNLKEARDELRETSVQLQALRDQPISKAVEKAAMKLHSRAHGAQWAESRLAQPGWEALFRKALRHELERAKSLPFLNDSTRSLLALHGAAAAAGAAAAEFDFEEMDSRLRMAEAAAKRGGLSFDANAIRESLKKRYLNADHGLELLKSGDPDKKQRVIESLGEMGPQAKEVIPALTKNIYGDYGEANPVELRIAAVSALGKMGPEGLGALVEGWQYRDWSPGPQELEEAITKALADHAPDSVPSLIRAFEYPNQQARIRAEEALVEIGPAAVPACLKALENPNSKVRWRGVRVLGRIHASSPEALKALGERLRDEDASVRNQVLETIAGLGPQAGPVWVEALGSKDVSIRKTAAKALPDFGPQVPGAVPGLIKALEDEDAFVRFYAVKALRKFGPAAKEAVPALMKMKERDGDSTNRAWADAAIKTIQK